MSIPDKVASYRDKPEADSDKGSPRVAAKRNGEIGVVESPGMTLLITPGSSPTIADHLAYIDRLVQQGGPTPEQYSEFDFWLSHVAEEIRAGRLSAGELRTIRDAFGRALSLETNQGLGLRKPHGYPGDYEIIDRIYRKHITDDPTLRNWDLYFHTQAAPRAVRNRKTYFVGLMKALQKFKPNTEPLHVLNVASGPSRDVFEFFSSVEDDGRICVECVDTDPDAIAYARSVCRPFLNRVTFKQANALRYTSDRKFDLIWSAGLFDYFGDKGFKFLVERLWDMLAEGGELVIGNFSRSNSTRHYMEVMGDWNLYYRDENDLRSIAHDCGIGDRNVRVDREREEVNLFLHLKRGDSFISDEVDAGCGTETKEDLL